MVHVSAAREPEEPVPFRVDDGARPADHHPRPGKNDSKIFAHATRNGAEIRTISTSKYANVVPEVIPFRSAVEFVVFRFFSLEVGRLRLPGKHHAGPQVLHALQTVRGAAHQTGSLPL